MKKILLVCMACCLTCFAALDAFADSKVSPQCTVKGVPLKGKVKQVQRNGDIKVKLVTSFPDLKVQRVTSFPDKCGKWQFVDNFADFTVEFVNSFEDIKVQYVNTFPGRP